MGDWLEVTHGPAAGTHLEVVAELAVGRLEAAPADLAGDLELSRRHARFWRAAGGELLVEDVGSANGTFVNDKRIDRPCVLSDGDSVNLGTTTLVVRQGKPTRVRAPAAESTEVRGAPHPDPAPSAGPPAPPAGSAPVSGRRERPWMRLVVLLCALLALAVAGLIASLVTRDGGIGSPASASAPVVSPIFPVTGLNYPGQEFASSTVNQADASVAATIDWGDGTPSSLGTLGPPTPDGEGRYTRSVSASHTYTRTATYLVTVTVKLSHGHAQTGSNLAVVTDCFCVTKLPTALRFVDLGPVSGNNLVKLPGPTGFVPLTAPREVPVGSQLDTTHGSVVVTARVAPKKTAAGEFDGGFFELLQPPTLGGLVQLNLQGETTANCRPGQTSPSAVLSFVHASVDVNGTFRTRGRDSAGTGRGAAWTTAEQCDGTLTRVQHGSVDVQNFRSGTTVAVSAGQSYLARGR